MLLDIKGSKLPPYDFSEISFCVLADTCIILVHLTCALVCAIGNGRFVRRFDFGDAFASHCVVPTIDTSHTDVIAFKAADTLLALDFRNQTAETHTL